MLALEQGSCPAGCWQPQAAAGAVRQDCPAGSLCLNSTPRQVVRGSLGVVGRNQPSRQSLLQPGHAFSTELALWSRECMGPSRLPQH